MELIGKTNTDFIGKKNISLVISSIVAIIGIIGMIQIARGVVNMGIDFTDWTSVELKFAQPVSLKQVRNTLAKHNLRDANLQEVRDGNKILIKVGKTARQRGR